MLGSVGAEPILKKVHLDGRVSINIGLMNCAGLKSKHGSIGNICLENDLKVLLLSETHLAGKEKPLVNESFVPFFRNRKENKSACKGGVAIMMHETLAPHCVVMDKGTGDEEWMTVKCNAFNTPTVFGVIYGYQEGRESPEKVKTMWKNITDKMIEYNDKGWTVYIGGDCNLAIGNNLGLKGNDDKVSEGGRRLIEWVEEHNEWCLANTMYRGDCRTHHDRSSGNKKCLDLLFTNRMEKVVQVDCDEKFLATPYTVLGDRDEDGVRYSDHKSVLATIDVGNSIKEVEIGRLCPSGQRNVTDRHK